MKTNNFNKRKHMLETLHKAYLYVIGDVLIRGENSLERANTKLSYKEQKELGRRLAKYWEVKK